jgi:hypothetical protein
MKALFLAVLLGSQIFKVGIFETNFGRGHCVEGERE